MELTIEREPKVLDSSSDEFGTPDYLYKPLDAEFHFEIDAAASPENTKCAQYFTKEDNALTLDWIRCAGSANVPPVFWCNPPYSRGNVEAFVKKAHEESQKGATVVMLLPARTEQSWFHDIVLKHAEVRFIRKRVTFVGGATSARFPSLVAIFPNRRERKERAWQMAAHIAEVDTNPETRCVP